MSFTGLCIALALLLYGLFTVLGSFLAAPLLRSAFRIQEPAHRADRLLAARMLPAALGAALVGGLFLPAFLWLEPRQTDENVSPAMLLLAALSAIPIAFGLGRGALSLWSTARLARRFRGQARPVALRGAPASAYAVDESFPLVALVGFFRPRLIIARNVLEACEPEELAAVAAHETGHLRHRDHWVRLALRSCPDPLSLLPLGDRVERAWAEAAEQRADDEASASGPAGALDLASALLKVARLARLSGGSHGIPLTALYRGEGISFRVARLLGPRHSVGKPARPLARTLLVSMAALALFVPPAAALGFLHQIHGWVEALVGLLQ